MRLADFAEIKSALGLDSTVETEQAVKSAIEMATDVLVSELRSPVEQATRIDDFMVTPLDYPRQVVDYIRLSGAFVSSVTSIVKASSIVNLDSADTYEDVEASFKVNMERGYASFPVSVLSPVTGISSFVTVQPLEVFFRVTYVSGFATADDQETFTGVPAWLQELTKLHVRISLDSHPAFRETLSTSDVKQLMSQKTAIIGRRARYMPWAQLPIQTQVS